MLESLGIPKQKAYEWSYTSKAYWRIATSPVLKRALPNDYLHRQSRSFGLINPGHDYEQLDEPPDAGPHVRWCGAGSGD